MCYLVDALYRCPGAIVFFSLMVVRVWGFGVEDLSLVLGLGYYINGVWSLWFKAILGFWGRASLYKHIRITVRVKIAPSMQMF